MIYEHYRKYTEEHILYERLLSALTAMRSNIYISPEHSGEKANDVLHRILLDHPELCHFEGKLSPTPWNNSICPRYTLTGLQKQVFGSVVEKILSEVKLPNPVSAVQQMSRIHDWCTANIRYDYDAPYGQSAYGALVERRAVCKGIAKAVQLLLLRLDIPCVLVEGSLDGRTKHVWNLYYADGQWLHCDVTMAYPSVRAAMGINWDNPYIAVLPDIITYTHQITNLDQLPTQVHIGFFQTLRSSRRNTPREDLEFPTQLLQQCEAPPKFLASGSVGDVYFAMIDDRPTAVKLIPCDRDIDRLLLAVQEVDLHQRVRGSFVSGIQSSRAFSTDSGIVYAIMQDYVMPLEEYCSSHTLTFQNVLKIARSICNALKYCWENGIAYLDVQPGNIYINRDQTALLGDFSSALPVDELAQGRDLRGTLAYMAPEVHYGQVYSPRSEIYSLGLLLYSLLNGGRIPFGDQYPVDKAISLRMRGEEVRSNSGNSQIDKVIEKACDYDPDDRYQSFSEFHQALDRLTDYVFSEYSTGSPQQTKPNNRFDIEDVDYAAWTVPILPQSYGTPFPEEDADYAALSVVIQPKHSAMTGREDPCERSDTPIPTSPVTVPDVGAGTLDPWNFDSFHTQRYDNRFSVPPRVKTDQVQFSAVAPKCVMPEDYAIVQIFMYDEWSQSAVEEAIQMADVPMQEKKTGFYCAAQGTHVKVVLSSPDAEILEDTCEQVWDGGYLCFDFALEVPKQLRKRQLLVKAQVYFDSIPVTRLLLTIKADDPVDTSIHISRRDIRSAFVSYASQDRGRVGILVQGMKKVCPDMDIFFDVTSLRSGDNWENILLQEISQRDLLYLCWSKNASYSPWVDREWRFALEQKGLEGIEPIPIDPPDVCPPPEELKSMHFNDSILFIINR